MISIFGLALSLVLNAGAASDPDVQCHALQSEMESWWKGEGNSDSRVVPAEKVDRALAILEQLRGASAAEVAHTTQALRTNFGDAYLDALATAGKECVQVRLTVVKALLNTKVGATARMDAIRRAVKKNLTATRYPTMLGVSIDAILTEFGLARGLWTSDELARAKVAKLRKDLKSDVLKWREQYDPVFAGLEFDLVNRSPEASAKFKTLPSFERIKAGALAELELSEGFSRRIEALIKELDAARPGAAAKPK